MVPVNGAAASLGGGTPIQVGVINPGNNGMNSAGNRTLAGFLANPLNFGFHNNNSGGVDGCNTPAMSGCQAANVPAALAVTSGFEFAISLADLGNPAEGSQLKIHASYGNGDNNYHSNQVLGGLPTGTANLGGNGAGGFTGTLSGVNFNNFAGDQYFELTVPRNVPEPGSIGLMAIGLIALIRLRSHRIRNRQLNRLICPPAVGLVRNLLT